MNTIKNWVGKAKDFGGSALDRIESTIENGGWKGVALSIVIIALAAIAFYYMLPLMQTNLLDPSLISIFPMIYCVAGASYGVYGLFHAMGKKADETFGEKSISVQEKMKQAAMLIVALAVAAFGPYLAIHAAYPMGWHARYSTWLLIGGVVFLGGAALLYGTWKEIHKPRVRSNEDAHQALSALQ